MKSPTILFTLFLFSTFTSYLPSATAQDPVYDTNHNRVLNNGEYYILPIKGSGIEVLQTGSDPYPLTIVQSSRLKLSTVFSSKIEIPTNYISQNQAFNITFGDPFRGKKWTVVNNQPEGLALKVEGYYTNTVKGNFRIKIFSATSANYKLLFCPDVGQCGNIAVYTDTEGFNRLVVSNTLAALEVKFQKYGSRFAMDNHLRSVTE